MRRAFLWGHMSDKRDEILLKTDKVTVAIEAMPEGKLRLNASPWESHRIIHADEVIWHSLQSQVTFKKAQ